MGIVYHANYLVWMEVARTELCKSLGVNYKQMESEDGILLAVAEARCRFLSPARYDEEIAIEASVSESSRRFITFDYDLRCEDRRIASGQTRHVFLNRELRPTRLPERFAALFGAIA